MSFRCSDKHYSCQSIQHLSTEGNDRKVTCCSVGSVAFFFLLCATVLVKFQKKLRVQTESIQLSLLQKILGQDAEKVHVHVHVDEKYEGKFKGMIYV